MSEFIVLTKLDGKADDILDAFQERTGLHGRDEVSQRTYPLHGSEHRVRVVQELTAIDDHWTDHVGVQIP
jgi:hypothetical protein